MRKDKLLQTKHRSRLAEIAGDREKIVLIVEDDSTHRRFMDEILKTCGFSTITAENGLVALARLDAGQNIDLIIMDWDMPEMDGLETVRRIRERQVKDNLPHIPIVAFTGHRLPGDREKCIAAGMDAYLPKAVWMPKWRQTLIDNLQGLIIGDFRPQEINDETDYPAVQAVPGPANFNLDEFNTAILEDTRSLLKAEFPEAVEDYLEDASSYIQKIKDGLADGDKDKVAKGSHPLKSNSKGFGLMGVAGIAEAINLAALKSMETGEPMETVHALLPQLLDAFQRAEKKLRAEV